MGDWKETIAEELRSDPSIKDFKDVDSLVKSYKETKAFVGSAMRIPGPDASKEDRAAFRAKLKEKVPELVEVPEDPEKLKEVEADLWARLGRPKEAKEYTAEGVQIP